MRCSQYAKDNRGVFGRGLMGSGGWPLYFRKKNTTFNILSIVYNITLYSNCTGDGDKFSL